MNTSSSMPPAGWIAIGAGLGTAIGAALDNIALGLAFGAALGVVVMAIQTNRAGRDDDSGDVE